MFLFFRQIVAKQKNKTEYKIVTHLLSKYTVIASATSYRVLV